MVLPDDMYGVITVLNTPFADDGAIETAGLRATIGRALDAGVVGFLAPALAGEVYTLSEAERRSLVETTLDAVRGRVPVIGGAYGRDQEERIRNAAWIADAGCAGVLVNIPFAEEAVFEEEVRRVADLGPGFIMIQDWDPDGDGLSVPFIAHLFETIDAFQCLKVEVVSAGPKYSEVLALTEGRLHVSGGWAVMQLIEALDRGVHAFMPTAMHAVYTRIYSLYASGDRAGAMELFHRLLPVLAFSNQCLDTSIHFFKRLLYAQGDFATARVRVPLGRFDGHHERIAAELIERVNVIEDSLTR